MTRTLFLGLPIRRAVVILASIALLNACGTPAIQHVNPPARVALPELPAPEHGEGLLYVFRPALDTTRSGDSPLLMVDDQPVARLRARSYAAIGLKPGHHILRVVPDDKPPDIWDIEAVLDVSEGQSHFLALWNTAQPSSGESSEYFATPAFHQPYNSAASPRVNAAGGALAALLITGIETFRHRQDHNSQPIQSGTTELKGEPSPNEVERSVAPSPGVGTEAMENASGDGPLGTKSEGQDRLPPEAATNLPTTAAAQAAALQIVRQGPIHLELVASEDGPPALAGLNRVAPSADHLEPASQ